MVNCENKLFDIKIVRGKRDGWGAVDKDIKISQYYSWFKGK